MPVFRTGSPKERFGTVSRKASAVTQIADHADHAELWRGAGWRLLVTAILLGTISGLIILAGNLSLG